MCSIGCADVKAEFCESHDFRLHNVELTLKPWLSASDPLHCVSSLAERVLGRAGAHWHSKREPVLVAIHITTHPHPRSRPTGVFAGKQDRPSRPKTSCSNWERGGTLRSDVLSSTWTKAHPSLGSDELYGYDENIRAARSGVDRLFTLAPYHQTDHRECARWRPISAGICTGRAQTQVAHCA